MSTSPSNSSKNNTLPTPFSLRLTFEERAALEQSAGTRPLGAYIRSKLFGGKEAPRRRRTRTKKPTKNGVQRTGSGLVICLTILPKKQITRPDPILSLMFFVRIWLRDWRVPESTQRFMHHRMIVHLRLLKLFMVMHGRVILAKVLSLWMVWKRLMSVMLLVVC